MTSLLTQDAPTTGEVFRPMEAQLVAMDGAKTPTERRVAICALEAASRDLPQQELPLRHHFAPGQYAREIFMAAGRAVVGKIHRHAHINVVSKGSCIVYTEDGTKRLEAGDTFVSLPGTKRAVFVLEDVLWTTVHANPTDSRDIDWLESQLIAPSFDALVYDEPLKVAA